MVLLMLGSANNDDREFEDPQTLDVERNNTRHLAFGGGVHRCLGSHLARQELMVALEEIFATLGTIQHPGRRRSQLRARNSQCPQPSAGVEGVGHHVASLDDETGVDRVRDTGDVAAGGTAQVDHGFGDVAGFNHRNIGQ